MGLFSKIKRAVQNTVDPFEVIKRDKKKKPQQAVDPDPINPLTGRPRSQDGAQDPFSQPSAGLGQMPSYQPAPLSADQRIPQGLGGNVFRSTLAPLQQQGYGLAQIDPRLLQSTVRFPGGSTLPQQQPPQMAPQAPIMDGPLGGFAKPSLLQMQQFGLGRLPRQYL